MAVYIYNMQYVISYIIHDTNQMIKVIGYICYWYDEDTHICYDILFIRHIWYAIMLYDIPYGYEPIYHIGYILHIWLIHIIPLDMT